MPYLRLPSVTDQSTPYNITGNSRRPVNKRRLPTAVSAEAAQTNKNKGCVSSCMHVYPIAWREMIMQTARWQAEARQDGVHLHVHVRKRTRRTRGG